MSKVGNTNSRNSSNVNNQSTANNVRPATAAKTAKPNTSLTNSSAQTTNYGAASKLGETRNFSDAVKRKLVARAGLDGNKGGAVSKTASGLGNEASVSRIRGQVVIDSGAGDDKIAVTQNATTGDITVSVNGESQTFRGREKNNLVIRAGEGNDSIRVVGNVTVNLRLEGGDGNDSIKGGNGNDKIEGGKGTDRLYGGGGDDYLNGSIGADTIYGDAGNDVVYGGDGADNVFGNAGDDYLEGGKGNDQIGGNGGNDVLSGGIGGDSLRGGIGDDVIYAGQGVDNIFGDSGNNKIFSQTDDTHQTAPQGSNNTVVTVELKGFPGGASVFISGSPEFRERVEADLEMLRSSPVGRQMLEGFDTAFNNDQVTVTIESLDDLGGSTEWENIAKPNRPQPFLDPATGVKGTPNSVTIRYNPTYMPTFDFAGEPSVETTPNVVLFHEMAHAYDLVNGSIRGETYSGNDVVDSNQIRAGERVAVGLPIDHDSDPNTAETTDSANHPDNLTENALRREMNFQERLHYVITGTSRV